MTPETVALLTIVVILLSIGSCLTLCCMCCAVPLCGLLYRLMFSQQKGETLVKYHVLSSADASHHFSGSEQFQASAPPMYDGVAEPVAYVYLVPPLVGVQTENSAVVLGEALVNNSEKERPQGGFKDIWAALLFIANVVVIAILAINAFSYFATLASANNVDSVSTSNMTAQTVLSGCIMLAVTGSLIGSLWLSFLMKHAEFLIEFVIWTNIAMMAISTIGCLVLLNILGALIFGVLTVINVWYYYSVKARIPFASAAVTTACTAIKANYLGILSTAYSMLFIQLVWFVLWAIAFFGVMYQFQQENDKNNADNNGSNNNDNDNSGYQGFVTFLLFVSFYWGMQVVKGIMQTTVSGTIACWWFQPTRTAPVRGSFFRAVTTSFGSICFGSLIVSIVQAIREMLNMLRNQAHSRRQRNRAFECLLAIADYLLSCIEAILIYFNMYAYCYVAAYGTDFITSGKQVSNLFHRRGWKAIINDSLISKTIFFGIITIGIMTGIVGAVFSLILNPSNGGSADPRINAVIGGIIGFIMGVIVGIIITNALESAVATVFVCFAEDPMTLKNNHPETYVNLLTKWDQVYPETVAWIHAAEATYVNSNTGNSPSSSSFSRGGGGAVPVVYHYGTVISNDNHSNYNNNGVNNNVTNNVIFEKTNIHSNSNNYNTNTHVSAPVYHYGNNYNNNSNNTVHAVGVPVVYTPNYLGQSQQQLYNSGSNSNYINNNNNGSENPPPYNPNFNV